MAALHPEIAAQWHTTMNGSLNPEQVVAGSTKKAWWLCPKGPDHEWEALIDSRKADTGCPFSRGLKVSDTNSLAVLHPEIAAQWHPSMRGSLTPEEVVAGSNKKVWWMCPKGPDHKWEATIVNRTAGKDCPVCNQGWIVQNVRLFVKSLIVGSPTVIDTLSPTDLYLLFQQTGVGAGPGKSLDFIKSLATGRFPVAELEKFVAEEQSLVDDFVEGIARRLEELEASECAQEGLPDSEIPEMSEVPLAKAAEEDDELPEVSAVGVLKAFEAGMATPSTFVLDPTGKIRWQHIGKAFYDRPLNEEIIDQLRKLPKG